MNSEPWGHEEQLRVHEKLVNSRGGIIWWRVGEGKTRPAIKIVESFAKEYAWEGTSICVVVLRPKAFIDFRLEVATLDIDCVILEDSLNDIPIATLQNMEQRKITFLLISCGRINSSIPPLLVDRRVKAAIIDELYMYKNPKAVRTKNIHKLTRRVPSVGLSGSIMTAYNIEDVYGQLWAVSKHFRVADSLTQFRSQYMNFKLMEARSGGKTWPHRSAKPGAYKLIMDKIKDVVDVYFPPNNARKVHMQSIKVPATEAQNQMFRDLKKWMEVEYEGKVFELKNTLQVALKIQEVANGWLKDENDVHNLVPSEKPSYILSKVEELIAAGEQVIIWCAFRYDVEMLSKFFQQNGIATLQFISGVQFPLDQWRNKDVMVTLATEASGSSVNHFDQTAYAIYFSQDYKWINLQQSMGRTSRRSSLHKDVYYYFFHVQGSLDEQLHRHVLGARNQELTLVQLGEEVRNWMLKR